MRRITLTAFLLVGVLGAAGCSKVQDAAQQAADRVQCGATERLADRLPDADRLDPSQMQQGASIARRIGDVLGRLPGDRVPVSVTEGLDRAATELDAASADFAADPAAAQARAAAAIAEVRTAITGATADLGC
ncbi:MAG: hypothetical protein ACKO2C_11300 [Actinomycetes bacterium]